MPHYLRAEMQVDATPAMHVRDPRVKAAFATAPGDIQGFGMDAAGLRHMTIPAYIIVGAGDTTTPPADNAAFAAKYIPHATLDVLPGPVGREIFDNECDQVGRDNYPEACVDAPASIGASCTSRSDRRRCASLIGSWTSAAKARRAIPLYAFPVAGRISMRA